MPLSSPAPDTVPLARRARPLLGTFVEIALAEANATAFEAGFAAISHVHDRMSFHLSDSDLSRIRAASAGDTVHVDPHTIRVLQVAEILYRTSGGLFDITIGRALVRDGFLPRPDGVRLTDFPGTADDIVLIDDNRLRCTRPVLIDLGGIAKGYAVDCAIAALRAAGVPAGIVNAGGDLRVFGPAAHIVHIRGETGELTAQLSLRDCAIASSSNRLTRRKRQGLPCSPHIGANREPRLIDETISVMASTCIIADAITKVAMTDPELADALLREHDGCVIRDTPGRIAF
jgi:FAD:protein FMN transferase